MDAVMVVLVLLALAWVCHVVDYTLRRPRRTSTVIRRQVNRAWRSYGQAMRCGYVSTAQRIREDIPDLERRYQEAVDRETKEQGS